jgi:hypothetical protein
LTESVGDIVLTCGGAANTLPLGSTIPAADVTVTLNTAVTSRLLPAGGVSNLSEALLLIDDPGSFFGSPAGNASLFQNAPQTLCPTPLTGCVEYVSSVMPTSGQFTGTPIFVATNSPQGSNATTAGYNVFQGIVNGNSVTFHGVPILPTIGSPELTRTFRITNLRADATQPLSPDPNQSGMLSVTAAIATAGPAAFPVTNPLNGVAFLENGMRTTAGAAPNLNQCSSQTKTQVNLLSFGEGFPSAFKTPVVAQTNTPSAGQSVSSPQNVPGSVYNSESNSVFGVGNGQTAGLLDFGTRLKAAFGNVPPGVRLFVSVSNVTNAATPVSVPAVIGGRTVKGRVSPSWLRAKPARSALSRQLTLVLEPAEAFQWWNSRL